MIFLFDIDGTLTKPGKKLDDEMRELLQKLLKDHEVYAITGSRYNKAITQLDGMHMELTGLFVQMGNEYWKYGRVIYRMAHKFPDSLIKSLEISMMKECGGYPFRHGNHIEDRGSMLNFSRCGRNASWWQRKLYRLWDYIGKERAGIANTLSDRFSTYDFLIGGEISIDVIPKGRDKGQVADFFGDQRVIAFGDKYLPGGNDYALTNKPHIQFIAVDSVGDTKCRIKECFK